MHMALVVNMRFREDVYNSRLSINRCGPPSSALSPNLPVPAAVCCGCAAGCTGSAPFGGCAGKQQPASGGATGRGAMWLCCM